MIGSLYTGISGLNVNSKAMSVIGDNIANVNTTAFKANSSSFASVLSQSLTGSGGTNVGRGAKYAGMSASWSQGTMETTASGTDLAVNGTGFFNVKDAAGNDYYTRSGHFEINADLALVNSENYNVQGYQVASVASDGSYTLGSIADIDLSGKTSPPQATTEMLKKMNLDAGATNTLPDAYSTTITVYDSLGNDIPTTFTFTKNATARSWDVAASIPSTAGTGAVISVGGVAASSIEFDSDGKLTSVTDTAAAAKTVDPVVTLTLTNGSTSPQTISWDLFTSNLTNGDITGHSGVSSTSFLNQNGYAAGTLAGVSIDEDGVVTGSFTNGELTPLFQVTLADFPNYQGLNGIGSGMYSESRASGQASPNTPGSGAMGLISVNALEMSNVDLANEFVKMMTTQRAFQANSRVITTSDEILQELINLKR